MFGKRKEPKPIEKPKTCDEVAERLRALEVKTRDHIEAADRERMVAKLKEDGAVGLSFSVYAIDSARGPMFAWYMLRLVDIDAKQDIFVSQATFPAIRALMDKIEAENAPETAMKPKGDHRSDAASTLKPKKR